MDMTNEFVLEAIKREFPDSIISVSEPYGFLTLELKKEDIKKVIHYLKETSLEINFLTDICGIHYPENKEKELGVIYHLHNLKTGFRIRLKAFGPRENIDFYGIKFKGHPDLRAILNMEDLGYHPMLKEYALEDGTRTDKDDKMFGR